MNQSIRAARILIPIFCALPAMATPLLSTTGWPRQFTDGTAKLVLYQPQVDSWPDFKSLTARCAVLLTPAKGAHPVWGVISLASETRVDLPTRTVEFEKFSVTAVSYPSAKDEHEAVTWQALTAKLLPPYPTTASLDTVMAYLDLDGPGPRQTDVQLAPPPILVSQFPAVLVIIDGEPILLDIEGTELQKIVNTNWDLFFEKDGGRYFLRDDKVWLSAKGLKEAWTPVTKLPKDFLRLPASEQYTEVLHSASKPQPPTVAKLVLVVDKPTELILVPPQPALWPVEGTNLMWVANTESDLFFDSASGEYYFLTSGRWFRSHELKSNGWVAATDSLPEDFKKIPVSHPRAHVLAAVPGTRQAEEAVLYAEIPQVAKIDRKTAKAEVKYVGEPKFEPIGDTGVSYARNTPNDVLHFGDRYYLCLDGVWFVAPEAKGPWETADTIPKEIYAIPPSSPKYPVTFVNVYDSDADSVTYGYTAGYSGVYVAYGVAMWGTGYYYSPFYAYGIYPYPVYWPCPFYTYGASAWYNPATGIYGRGSDLYGPYGGYARAAAYNPATGSYAWGRSAWGAYGAAASGGFYNPSNGSWGAGYRGSNGYQSWGQSVISRGGQTVRTAGYADSRGAVGALQTSSGGKAVAARGSQGQGQGFAGKSAAGDFYAGKDGNVYKRDQSGQWYRNSGGSWESVNRPAASTGGADRTDFRAARPSAPQGAAADKQSVQSGLNRDATARTWGNYNAQRSQPSSKGGGNNWSSGGFVGRNASGWSLRSPGFGRR